MLDLNARTAFNTCRAVVPHLLSGAGGRIINVSARAATQGKARMAPYCVSKAAVITLTESLAAEHKHDGINVNCILPGTVDTPQNRAAMPGQDFDKWVPPAALADVILFLASDAARCVTGAAVPVYGQS
jgi:NAD(P)-dependent dehydrogenase (short-subunit alcohol dehydrogenase family)